MPLRRVPPVAHIRQAALALCLLVSIPAVAAEDTATVDAPVDSDASPTTAMRSSTANGSLLMFAQSPAVRAQQATVFGLGGYDTAAKTATVEAITEVRVVGPLSLRGGAVYTHAGQRLRPTVGARVQVLNADAHGVDGAFGVFYRPEGLTEPEGEVEAVASIGRRAGPAYVIGNLAYGQDPEGNERDGEVRLAGLVPVARRLVLGVDARVRFDLGSGRAKVAASGEPTFDLAAGPMASLFLGPVAILAQAGPSARKAGGVTTYGAYAMTGLGTAF